MKIWKILIQILIDILVMIGLLCLMAHLITAWKFDIIASGLFGIFIGIAIITIWHVVFLMLDER